MISKFLLSSSLLLAMAASAAAADLPSEKGPPVYAPPPPPVFSWTGVYIGGQVGYEWGTSSNTYFGPAGGFIGVGHHDDEGVVGGGHVGYNYELGSLGGFLPGLGGTGGGVVIGIEGDVNGSSYDGTGGLLAGVIQRHDDTEFDGSIRGRVGIAFDRALIYGTGGVAFGSIRNTATNFITGGFDSATTGRVGWTAGGGVEYAIDNNWSVRVEYRYTDYGTFGFNLFNSTAGIPVTDRVHDTDNRVQAGFSYKFDEAPPPAPPVVAKY
jgi:outer membrane immunogenic protein